MKIVTVNVPEAYIEAIEKLTYDGGLYPSRSELIRCAVREFLLKELKMAKAMNRNKRKQKKEEDDFDDENFVRVPVKDNGGNGKVTEFKTYKIIRKLEH